VGNGDDAEPVGPEPLLDPGAQVLAPLLHTRRPPESASEKGRETSPYGAVPESAAHLEVGEGDGDGADGRRRRRLVLHGSAPEQAGWAC
jgi:hypothetical protein